MCTKQFLLNIEEINFKVLENDSLQYKKTLMQSCMKKKSIEWMIEKLSCKLNDCLIYKMSGDRHINYYI